MGVEVCRTLHAVLRKAARGREPETSVKAATHSFVTDASLRSQNTMIQDLCVRDSDHYCKRHGDEALARSKCSTRARRIQADSVSLDVRMNRRGLLMEHMLSRSAVRCNPGGGLRTPSIRTGPRRGIQ